MYFAYSCENAKRQEIYKLKDPCFIGYLANCIQSDVSYKYGFIKKISKILVVD